MDSDQISGLTRVAVIGVLTALAALGTLLIRIPIPATNGYFNIGDVFVVLSGLWLGPVAGLTVGGIGPAIADAIGFPAYIPATAVTKGMEGLLVGLIAGGGAAYSRKIAAVVVGGVTIVAGYFVFQAYIYPSLAESIPLFAVTSPDAAVVELIPNAIQGFIGAIAGLALWRAIEGSPSEGLQTAEEYDEI